MLTQEPGPPGGAVTEDGVTGLGRRGRRSGGEGGDGEGAPQSQETPAQLTAAQPARRTVGHGRALLCHVRGLSTPVPGRGAGNWATSLTNPQSPNGPRPLPVRRPSARRQQNLTG